MGYIEEEKGYTEEEKGYNEEEKGYIEEEKGYTEEEKGCTEGEKGYTEEEKGYTDKQSCVVWKDSKRVREGYRCIPEGVNLSCLSAFLWLSFRFKTFLSPPPSGVSTQDNSPPSLTLVYQILKNPRIYKF